MHQHLRFLQHSSASSAEESWRRAEASAVVRNSLAICSNSRWVICLDRDFPYGLASMPLDILFLPWFTFLRLLLSVVFPVIVSSLLSISPEPEMAEL